MLVGLRWVLMSAGRLQDSPQWKLQGFRVADGGGSHRRLPLLDSQDHLQFLPIIFSRTLEGLHLHVFRTARQLCMGGQSTAASFLILTSIF